MVVNSYLILSQGVFLCLHVSYSPFYFPVPQSCLDFFFCNICFVLYCPFISFPNSAPDLWNNIFFWTVTVQVIYPVSFLFFRSLSPSTSIWTGYCCHLEASFLLLCWTSNFPDHLYFFSRNILPFSRAHILITRWLNYLVLRCLKIHFILL